MTDTERLDWLDKNGSFVSRWDHQRGFILEKTPHVTGEGHTFRQALDSLISPHDYVRNNWTH